MNNSTVKTCLREIYKRIAALSNEIARANSAALNAERMNSVALLQTRRTLVRWIAGLVVINITMLAAVAALVWTHAG